MESEDMEDGGENNFEEVIKEVREEEKEKKIEIMKKELMRKEGEMEIVVKDRNEVLKKNIEKVK